MSKEIATRVKDKTQLELLLRTLVVLGHRIHGNDTSVEYFLSKYGERREIAVTSTQIYGKYLGYDGPDMLPVGDFLLQATLMKFPLYIPVEVKLNQEYTAVIGKTETQVGCQAIPNEAILAVAEAIKNQSK